MNTKSSKEVRFPFSTIMPVRITDINYGMHLGHIATAGIFHNARVLFMTTNGFEDMNIDGVGLILLNSQYSFKSEATFNTNLLVNVAVDNISKLKFNFIYQALNHNTGVVISEGREEFSCFDYTKRKITRIPARFLEFCKMNQNHATNIK